MVNVTKAKAAVEGAKREINAIHKEAIAASEKDALQIEAIRPLGRATAALDKALEKLDLAVTKTTVKAKKEKTKK